MNTNTKNTNTNTALGIDALRDQMVKDTHQKKMDALLRHIRKVEKKMKKEHDDLMNHENNFAIFIEYFSSLSMDDRIDKIFEIYDDKNHEFHNRTTELIEFLY